MSNGVFQLGWSDLGKGLVVAVLAPVLFQVAVWLNVPGFDILTFNWLEVLRIALSAGVGYLAKNLLTDNKGNILAIGS